MKKIKLKINMSKNKINVAKISSGTMIGHVISLITLPILTRLYGAEIFGIWALLNSIAILITSVSDLGMSNLIMIDKKENLLKSYKIISTVSLLISTFFSLLTTVIYTELFNNVSINSVVFFLMIFLISFLSQQIQICYTWLNRNEKYGVLMKNPIINYSFYGIIGIIFGYLGFVEYGFYLAHILGSLATLIHMKRNLPKSFLNLNIREIYLFIRENKKFVLYQIPTNISNNLKSQMPTFLVNFYWGTVILGYFSITVRILQMPIILIAKAIGRVFFRTITEMERQSKNIGDYVLRNMFRAIKFSIVPIIVLIGFGDIITVLFLGEKWEMSGDFVRVLALQYFFVFLQDSLQGLAITINKQKYSLISNTFHIFGLLLAMILGKYLFNDVLISMLMFSMFTIIIQVVYFSSLFKVIKVPRKTYLVGVFNSISIILIFSFVLRQCFNYLF